MPGYLVSPPSNVKVRGCAIFGHPASGSSASFLEEAKQLAPLGIRSYCVDFPFERNTDDPGNLKNPDREIDFRKSCLSKIQSAATRLLSEERLPLVYVGKNFGAYMGGLAAGFEKRISHFILAAGLPDLTDFYVSSDHSVALAARGSVSTRELEKYRERTHYLNPAQILPRCVKTDIFFQFGTKDSWIPDDVAQKYIQASRGKTRVIYYDDHHEFENADAMMDRRRYFEGLTTRYEEAPAASSIENGSEGPDCRGLHREQPLRRSQNDPSIPRSN
jgi:hypothetical protein